ncbi:hypothetical protein ACJ73_00058 [Blastomyces percursus]|uniref:Zn(2)-C6 fungal-type domain-containing protein n=1 Tax=Blastomyces percursus TaxID=1658174 RepID=A0A1J9R826_9EURO|nr:hypothetical protein ACJ73_00058 [Blastomyces percursus]
MADQLQEWKQHFGIGDDAFIVLKYLMSTKMGEESPTNPKDPFLQALEPWIQRFNISDNAVTVLEYLLYKQKLNAVEFGTHDWNTSPSYVAPPARDSYSLDTSQLGNSASDAYISTMRAAGVSDVQTFDQATIGQATFLADWPFSDIAALQTLGQGLGYQADFHAFPDDHHNFGGPPTSQTFLEPSSSAAMTLVPGISEGFCGPVHEAVSKEVGKGKPCIRCWLEKRKCDGDDAQLCSRCMSTGVSLSQSVCIRVRFADEAIFSKLLLKHEVSGPMVSINCRKFCPTSVDQTTIFWKDKTGWKGIPTSAYCLKSAPYLHGYIDEYVSYYLRTISRESSCLGLLFRIASMCVKEPLIQHSLRLWVATRLLVKGWYIHGDEKLEMTEVTQPSSPLYGTVPVPRVLQNQLDHALEDYIVLCEALFLRNLQNVIKRRDRSQWVVIFLALTIMLNVLERDVWRLLYWIRHPAEANAWRHPSRPCTLVAKNIYLSNLMLSHFRSATGGQSPLALGWSDSSIATLVDGNEHIINAMIQLRSYITYFGGMCQYAEDIGLALMQTEPLRDMKGYHKYEEANDSSLDFTLSLLPFSRDYFAQLGDFVGDGQFR